MKMLLNHAAYILFATLVMLAVCACVVGVMERGKYGPETQPVHPSRKAETKVAWLPPRKIIPLGAGAYLFA